MEDTMKRLTLILGLLLLLSAVLFAEDMTVSTYSNEVRLISSSANNIIAELSLGQFSREAVQINGSTWYELSLKKACLTLEPGLPNTCDGRKLHYPGTARMDHSEHNTEYATRNLLPSKGNLTRDIDPASVPYTFGEFYNTSGSYPEQIAYITEPFIIRDYRGITVRFQPFVYMPETQTLRVFTKVRVALNNTGTDLTNSIPSPRNTYSRFFEEIYSNLFLNFGDAKYPLLDEQGRILVIKHSMFDTTIQPYVIGSVKTATQ
jgi:hypothetical protein